MGCFWQSWNSDCFKSAAEHRKSTWDCEQNHGSIVLHLARLRVEWGSGEAGNGSFPVLPAMRHWRENNEQNSGNARGHFKNQGQGRKSRPVNRRHC